MLGNDDYVPDVNIADSQLEATLGSCSDYAALYEGTVSNRNLKVLILFLDI